MFGLLRTVLALMVMLYHLLIEIPFIGTYAVYGFYMLSGYLMTLVMHESYGYSAQGRLKFIYNRFLRLYPTYWLALVLSVLLVLTLSSEFTSSYRSSVYFDFNVSSLLMNISMIFPSWYPYEISPRLVPPSWALTIEIFFYILISLGLSRNFRLVIIWFSLSCIYVVYTIVEGLTWIDRYFPIAAASLPFSIGALIYFVSNSKGIAFFYRKSGFKSWVLLLAILSNTALWSYFHTITSGRILEVGFYINLGLFALLILNIVLGKEIFALSKSFDRFVGNLSFPIYLMHIQAGMLCSYILFERSVRVELSLFGMYHFIFAVILVLIISVLTNYLIDTPIQTIREKIKNRHSEIQRPLSENIQ